jgi:hypothetical protein
MQRYTHPMDTLLILLFLACVWNLATVCLVHLRRPFQAGALYAHVAVLGRGAPSHQGRARSRQPMSHLESALLRMSFRGGSPNPREMYRAIKRQFVCRQ